LVVIVSLIVARSLNGVIGNDGGLPWRLPRDLKRFRAVTMGKPLIMGRATRQSIGRPLDGRANIVLSRDPQYDYVEGGAVVRSLEDALATARAELGRTGSNEVMIIGGESVFRAFAPICDRLYLTTVLAEIEGDRFFRPETLAQDAWSVVEREHWPADSKNAFGATFEIWECVRSQAIEPG
jgi:dihydrofolate reductase